MVGYFLGVGLKHPNDYTYKLALAIINANLTDNQRSPTADYDFICKFRREFHVKRDASPHVQPTYKDFPKDVSKFNSAYPDRALQDVVVSRVCDRRLNELMRKDNMPTRDSNKQHNF